MKKRKVTIPIIIALTTLAVLITACDNTYDPNDGFTSLHYRMDSADYLVSQISSAQSSVKLAINNVDNNAVITALNSAADRGIDTDLVLDAQSAIPAALSASVDVKTGNSSGSMESNFLMIDDYSAFFLSSSDLSSQSILYIKIRGEYLLNMLETEFRQLHLLENYGAGSGPDGEGKKQKINYLTSFYAGANEVEMYFVPQNQVISGSSSYLLSRMGQVRSRAFVAAAWLDNDMLANSLLDWTYNGINTEVVLGNDQNLGSVSLDMTELNNSGVLTISGSSLPFNIIALDEGTQFQSLIFTTFSLNSTGQINVSDGVCLIINGPAVERICDAVRSVIP